MAEQSARDAAALEVTRWFAHEDDYPDFDAAGGVRAPGRGDSLQHGQLRSRHSGLA